MLLFDWFIFNQAWYFCLMLPSHAQELFHQTLVNWALYRALTWATTSLTVSLCEGLESWRSHPYSLVRTPFEIIDFLIRNTMNGNFCIGRAWWSVLHHLFSGGMVRLLIEKTQFPTKRSQSPRAKCFHAYPGGEHECHRAWFETATVVVQHRTFSLLCRRLDTPLFVW